MTKTDNKPKCEQYCSRCLCHVPKFTKRFHRDVVITLLTEKVFSAATRPTYSSLIKSLKAKKADIFHSEDVPKQSMGQIHALALQMLCNIIGLDVSDRSKIGKEEFNENYVCISLPVEKFGSMSKPVFTIETRWDGLNLA